MPVSRVCNIAPTNFDGQTDEGCVDDAPDDDETGRTMTVLTTKLAALKDLRVARTQIRAAMLPQPELTRAALSTSAEQRLLTAAGLMRGLDSRRPTAGVVDAATGAAEAVARPGHAFRDLHEASMQTRTGISILKHEPDVSKHIADRRAALRAAFAEAGR